MKTITTIVAFAALLASAPSFAEDAKTETKERARVEKQEAPRRLSTVDRWRGAPYARSGSYNDALIRQEALDKTLPELSTTANFATTPSF
jgi:hypothetical protein